MKKVAFLAVAFALVVVSSPWVAGDEPAKAREPAPKMRGQLPQNWGKLGLSDEQKQKIYDLQGKHRAKIDALERQIAELKDQQKKDMESVLTTAQKARLREIISGRVPGDDKEVKPKDKP